MEIGQGWNERTQSERQAFHDGNAQTRANGAFALLMQKKRKKNVTFFFDAMIGIKRRVLRIGLGWPVLCASPIVEVVMGVKDLREKNLLARNDVFSSLINALFLFKIRPSDLEELSPELVVTVEKGIEHRLRDVYKRLLDHHL